MQLNASPTALAPGLKPVTPLFPNNGPTCVYCSRCVCDVCVVCVIYPPVCVVCVSINGCCAPRPAPSAVHSQSAAAADPATLQLPDRNRAAKGRAGRLPQRASGLPGGQREVKKPHTHARTPAHSETLEPTPQTPLTLNRVFLFFCVMGLAYFQLTRIKSLNMFNFGLLL